jgi:homoserine kinase
MLLAVPSASLATKKARALLPESYSKADAIFNVQRASLLVAAFAQGRLGPAEATAMQDRMHQPYRAVALSAAEDSCFRSIAEPEIAGVALSGAGPSVLLFLAEGTSRTGSRNSASRGLVDVSEVELLPLRMADGVVQTIL